MSKTPVYTAKLRIQHFIIHQANTSTQCIKDQAMTDIRQPVRGAHHDNGSLVAAGPRETCCRRDIAVMTRTCSCQVHGHQQNMSHSAVEKMSPRASQQIQMLTQSTLQSPMMLAATTRHYLIHQH